MVANATLWYTKINIPPPNIQKPKHLTSVDKPKPLCERIKSIERELLKLGTCIDSAKFFQFPQAEQYTVNLSDAEIANIAQQYIDHLLCMESNQIKEVAESSLIPHDIAENIGGVRLVIQLALGCVKRSFRELIERRIEVKNKKRIRVFRLTDTNVIVALEWKKIQSKPVSETVEQPVELQDTSNP